MSQDRKRVFSKIDDSSKSLRIKPSPVKSIGSYGNGSLPPLSSANVKNEIANRTAAAMLDIKETKSRLGSKKKYGFGEVYRSTLQESPALSFDSSGRYWCRFRVQSLIRTRDKHRFDKIKAIKLYCYPLGPKSAGDGFEVNAVISGAWIEPPISRGNDINII